MMHWRVFCQDAEWVPYHTVILLVRMFSMVPLYKVLMMGARALAFLSLQKK